MKLIPVVVTNYLPTGT